MTLRVTLEIVPHGDEERKRVIGVVNIHNVGAAHSPPEPDFCRYLYEVYDSNGDKKTGFIGCHNRGRGAAHLISNVFNALGVWP